MQFDLFFPFIPFYVVGNTLNNRIISVRYMSASNNKKKVITDSRNLSFQNCAEESNFPQQQLPWDCYVHENKLLLHLNHYVF